MASVVPSIRRRPLLAAPAVPLATGCSRRIMRRLFSARKQLHRWSCTTISSYGNGFEIRLLPAAVSGAEPLELSPARRAAEGTDSAEAGLRTVDRCLARDCSGKVVVKRSCTVMRDIRLIDLNLLVTLNA